MNMKARLYEAGLGRIFLERLAFGSKFDPVLKGVLSSFSQNEYIKKKILREAAEALHDYLESGWKDTLDDVRCC